GSNIFLGMVAVIENLNTKNPGDITDALKLTAMSLISKVGGASGPLYGTAFLEMAKKSTQTTDLNQLLDVALQGIIKRGGAEVGDKTLVDVWTVIIDKLKTSKLTLEDIEETVEKTKDLVAHKGRASYLGERSKGHLDPGAVPSGYLFDSLLEAEG
ncbi:dihydroxyacetone kinase subunit DhaL, partial [Ligilactobacillus aviarius]|uniref:dihydroxyacetone kinase subunit DhaL n=1 Tax=Ligilactobacillus aviarius TaxID=1606 RepID=UPI0038906690